MARATGLEPAASGVTGRRSNQLSYARNPKSAPALLLDTLSREARLREAGGPVKVTPCGSRRPARPPADETARPQPPAQGASCHHHHPCCAGRLLTNSAAFRTPVCPRRLAGGR